jgi:hypothetical protein
MRPLSWVERPYSLFMIRSSRNSGAILVVVITTMSWIGCEAQSQDGSTPTIQVNSSLVLVDVIAENTKTALRTRELLTDLKREDFRIFDSGHEMAIDTFDIGAQRTTRPIALWLIVQCKEPLPPDWHSDFILGKTRVLRPALYHLTADDAVGVAHWCDDGNAVIDLQPGHDPDAALSKVEEVLGQKPIEGQNRAGELAMQKMIRLVLKNTHQTTPERLPVFLFLYGDHCATYVDEANAILRDLLETSGLVFGINDNKVPFNFQFAANGGQIFYLVHYYSQETGGEIYSSTDLTLFSNALDYILTQLHLRYTMGFKPKKLDGKRHTLKVELTSEARKKFPAAELRYRPEYVPVAVPDSFR